MRPVLRTTYTYTEYNALLECLTNIYKYESVFSKVYHTAT